MKITKIQIEAIYEVAVKIFADQMTFKAGIKVLQVQYQWNPTSARYYIKDHSLMMTGELFQRAMSAPATDYFLSRIAKDRGPLALETAVRAVRKHIKYYEGIRPVTLRALSLVAAKYEFSVPKPISLAEEEESFRAQVKLAFGATAEQRQAQLNASPKLPEKVARLVETFKRSP